MTDLTKLKLEIVAMLPWKRTFKIKDGKNLWNDLSLFEVIAQLRTGPDTASRLISNLHQYMSLSFSDNDIIITWVMTGQQTRALYALRWGSFKTGYLSVVLSDAGPDDIRALPIPMFEVEIIDITVTDSSGVPGG